MTAADEQKEPKIRKAPKNSLEDWTDQDDLILKENAGNMSADDIAKLVNSTKQRTTTRMRRLGLDWKTKKPMSDEGGCRMARKNSGNYDCPPGKSLRQKTTFLGLVKLGKVCLSDYEVEALRQGERHRVLNNFSNSMRNLSESMQPPKVINCYSNTYGNYTSTSCY